MTALTRPRLSRSVIPRASWALPVAGIVSLLVIWQVAALLVEANAEHPERILPTIGYVVGDALPEIATVGKENAQPSYSGAFKVLGEQALITIRRVFLGSLIGAVIGISLGFAVALNRYVRRTLYPPVNVLRHFPLLALSILFLIWFGGSERGILAFIGFGVATMLFVNTIAAVRNVPVTQVRYAETLGAGRWRVFRTVIVPAVVPELMSGIKIAVGLAWAMALGAEYLGTQEGLGRLMLYFELFQFTGRMVVVVICFVLLGVGSHLLLTAVGNRLTRWSPARA